MQSKNKVRLKLALATLQSFPDWLSNSIPQMVSGVDSAKRALIILIRTLAELYGCSVNVTRDSVDAVAKRAFRTLSRKVHPDHGGSTADQTRLNLAYEAWCEALRHRGSAGRSAAAAA